MSTRTRKSTHLPKPPRPTRKPVELTTVTVEDGSLPPKTDLDRSDDRFSSSKLDIFDPTDETHERKLDLPRFVQIHQYSGEGLVVFG